MRCRKCSPVPEEVRRAADLLERRYSVSIIYASHAGASRFNEFRQAIGPIPPGTLAARLSELEEAGLLERHVVDARPPGAGGGGPAGAPRGGRAPAPGRVRAYRARAQAEERDRRARELGRFGDLGG